MTNMRGCVNQLTVKQNLLLWRYWTCPFLATFAPGATATSEPSKQAVPRKKTQPLFGPSLHHQPTASVAAWHFPATVSPWLGGCNKAVVDKYVISIVQIILNTTGISRSSLSPRHSNWTLDWILFMELFWELVHEVGKQCRVYGKRVYIPLTHAIPRKPWWVSGSISILEWVQIWGHLC